MSETWTADEVADLLAEALDKPTAERDAFLDSSCAGRDDLRREVTSLLEAQRDMDRFMTAPALETARDAGLLEERELAIGSRVGAFTLVRKLGAGGAGVVYEAEQDRPRRRVALKTVRLRLVSEAALRRFEAEAELLARLQHPGVAQVIQAGVHDQDGSPVPYFALEFLEGARPITAYADEHALPTKKRLELFLDVCRAATHAHGKGIVHRDLKPGNVLVDVMGRVKVIDFGIAGTLHEGEGGTAVVAGTLPYMSPEQLEADPAADVRSDVYALGVLLFRMLSGRLPFSVEGASPSDAARRIRNEAPMKLRAARPGLSRDLEAIVERAMCRDPDARYPTASALADDIRRHLDGLPVEARPRTLGYVFGRFVRRHWVLAATVACIGALLVAAAVVSTLFALEAQRQREETEFESYRAQVAGAAAALRVNDVGEARQRLDQAPSEHRGWEWHHLRRRLDQSQARIRWPDRGCWTGAVSPDGALAAASATQTDAKHTEVAVWELAARERIATHAVRPIRVDSLAFATDGGRLALGYKDGWLEVRDARSGTVEASVHAHEGAVIDVQFAPDDSALATASRDGTIALWNPETGRRLRTYVGHQDRVIGIAYDREGKRLASGCRDGEIRIWDVAAAQTIATLSGHTGSVESVAWSPDGKRLASVSRDQSVRLWEVDAGRAVSIETVHASNVREVAFSPDGSVFASASYDRTLALWDGTDGGFLARLRGHETAVSAVAFASPRELVSFSWDGTLRLWNPKAPEAVPTLLGHSDHVVDLVFLRDGALASASRDGTVRFWSVADRQLLDTWVPDPDHALTRLALAPDGRRLHACSARGVIGTFDLEGRRAAPGVQGMGGYDLATDGRLFYRGMPSGQLARFDTGGEAVGPTLRPFTDDATAIALGRGLDEVWCGSRPGALQLWSLPANEAIWRAHPHTAAINHIAVHPDGAVAATASSDHTLSLVERATGRVRALLRGHRDVVNVCLFSPDGARLASGSRDGTVRLWHVGRGEQMAVLHGHKYFIRALAFSADGRILASGGGATDMPGVIKLWMTE